MNTGILKLHGVNFAYGERPALQNITFDLNEGEMIIKGDDIGVYPYRMFILRSGKYLNFPSSSVCTFPYPPVAELKL